MANEYSVNKSDLTIVADAIREKTETGSKIVFPSGFKSGIDEVFDAGTDALWDAIQFNGTRTGYESAFLEWGAEYIRPKHKVIPTGYAVRNMFAFCPNLKKIESEYFDFSQVPTNDTNYGNGWYLTFTGCPSLEEVEDIGMKAGYYYRTWRNCPNLKTIAVVRFNASTMIANAFDGCTSLENVTIEGTIGQSISFVDSPLTLESAKSVINALADNLANPGTKTVTFSQSTKDLLEAEGTVWGGMHWDSHITTGLGWNC